MLYECGEEMKMVTQEERPAATKMQPFNPVCIFHPSAAGTGMLPVLMRAAYPGWNNSQRRTS